MVKITLNDINGALGTINQILPAAIAAYNTLYAIFKQAHPDATFADFNAALLADSLDVQAISAAWFQANGYVKNSAGNWVKA